MTKQKTSITINRDKVDEVMRITGASSTSAAIEIALSEMIALARLRRDVIAYRTEPPTDGELALARLPHNWSDLADATDWTALYPEGPE